jgi:cysteine desulfurase/selenocysteine lyase
MTIADIRRDFPSLAHCTHLNCGGMAPMPTPVIDELLRLPQYVGAYGPALLLGHAEELTHSEAAHRSVADMIGAESDEMAFTTQFSTAVNIVVEGLDWHAGDEIIVTDQEHPAMLTPLLNMARRRDLLIRRLPVAESDDAMLSGLAALLTPRTRLLAASHVTTETGTRLPVAEMARLAHERGALVFYDGAQSLGQIPVDVGAIGCDFYAVVGYKWLFGPYPSAALHIRRDVLDRVAVTWTGSRATETARIDMDMESMTFIAGARRFEYGGRVFAYDSAMAAGSDYVARLGIEAIEAHARHLTEYFHDALPRVPGIRIESTRDLRAATGIVTIGVPGIDGPTLSTALRERWNILTRPALRGTSVRVSLAAFTSEQDLDALVEGVATVVAAR